jgi:hypothetical protein
MTVRKYSSTSQEVTLTSALTNSASTMVVSSASALLSGITPAAGETFTVVIDPDTSLEEIVDVISPSSPSSTTLTITRGSGVDGTTAIAHSAGAKVRHMAIGRDFREANTHIKNETTAHGLTIANVLETTDTNMITTAMLQSNAVTTAKITDANVTAAKLAADSVTTAKITDLNVTTGKLADLAVTTGKVADSAITSAKIADGTIVAGDIADGAVTSAKILDGTIVNGDIATGAAIAATKISGTAVTQADTGTVTSAMIANSTIVNADIASGAAIDLTKLATDPLARANHTGTQTASTISDFDTQVRTSKVTDLTAPTGSFSMNSQKITNLATPTSNADASTKAYVDTSIANLIDGAPSTLDTLNEIAAALADTANFSDTVVLKAGSTMTGALTLSGAPSSNLHAATKAYVDAVGSAVSADAATASAAATAAAASYDSFDDRYLGAKSSAPSVDNDGNALVAGALYWNTTTGAMQVWDAVGSAWENITSAATSTRWRKTAAGSETTLTGTDDSSVSLSYTVGYEQVYLNGVLLVRGQDYTASSGTSITGLSPALAVDDVVEVLSWTPYSVANALTTTIVDAKGDLLAATADNTVGRLAVGTNGFVLTADSSQTTGLRWGTIPLDLTINAQTGTSYTLVSTDLNDLVTLTNASAIALTLPPSVFTVGQQIHFAQLGAGQVTFTQGSGVTINSTGATSTAPKIRAQYATATAICIATNTFLVIGDIA